MSCCCCLCTGARSGPRVMRFTVDRRTFQASAAVEGRPSRLLQTSLVAPGGLQHRARLLRTDPAGPCFPAGNCHSSTEFNLSLEVRGKDTSCPPSSHAVHVSSCPCRPGGRVQLTGLHWSSHLALFHDSSPLTSSAATAGHQVSPLPSRRAERDRDKVVER